MNQDPDMPPVDAGQEPKANILVVDDAPANLRVLSQMLTERGYKVRPVLSGVRALAAIQSTRPDLILLDVLMPELNGYEVCQRLKADARTRDIPIIFISALSETEDKVRAFQAGGVDYVTKPFQMDEVAARVETHLALQRLQKSVEEKNVQLEQEIVERKQAEESLRQYAAELEAHNAELDAFAHTVAHDLKNPLNIILGYTTLLESAMLDSASVSPEELQVSVLGIGKAVRKMNDIVESLLLLAGVRKQIVECKELDMALIVAEVQHRLVPMVKEYQAELDVSDSWPTALGYAPWVEEVWANYVTNAIKYGGRPPRVEIGFSQSAIRHPPSAIRFWVRDNGPGLSPAEQARLFTPFTRLHKDRAEGHGLGLSIVQRIIEKLGGQVGVESEPGQGSVFFFTLPGTE